MVVVAFFTFIGLSKSIFDSSATQDEIAKILTRNQANTVEKRFKSVKPVTPVKPTPSIEIGKKRKMDEPGDEEEPAKRVKLNSPQ